MYLSVFLLGYLEAKHSDPKRKHWKAEKLRQKVEYEDAAYVKLLMPSSPPCKMQYGSLLGCNTFYHDDQMRGIFSQPSKMHLFVHKMFLLHIVARFDQARTWHWMMSWLETSTLAAEVWISSPASDLSTVVPLLTGLWGRCPFLLGLL